MYPELGKISLIRAERNHQWREFLRMNEEYEASRGIPKSSEIEKDIRQKLNFKLMEWGKLNNFLIKWRLYSEIILSMELDEIYRDITEKEATNDNSK